MTYAFYIAHSTKGRTRIRWAGNDSDKTTISEVAENIAAIEGVGQAIPRITTGSIIIEHDATPWPTIQPQLTDQLSLQFTSPAPAHTHTGLEALNKRLDQVDGMLKGMNTDLKSLTVFMLVVLAITQAMRGQVMVSSASLFWYALSVASKARNNAGETLETAGDAAE
jgi:hypothetical protein